MNESVVYGGCLGDKTKDSVKKEKEEKKENSACFHFSGTQKDEEDRSGVDGKR